MEYCAKVNIGVPGYGRVTPGEYLDEKCKAVLGDDTISDLLRRGALKVEADEPEEPDENGNADEKNDANVGGNAPDEGDAAPEEAAEEDVDEAELEPDTMDDVVDDAEEPAPAPAEKPKKNSGGRKAK